MTGIEMVTLRDLLLDAVKRAREEREYYEQKLDNLPDEVVTDEIKRYRQYRKTAANWEEVGSMVINAIEMRHVDLNL